MKKEKAYKIRRKIQVEKEMNKFKQQAKPSSKTWVHDLSPSGLKGGASDDKRTLDSYLPNNQLQLINRGTDCFVNSVIQLMRNTDYAQFIRDHLPLLIVNSTQDSYKLSKRLRYIYMKRIL